MMNKTLSYNLGCALLGITILGGCSSGGTTTSNSDSSLTPIGGAHVEADVANGKIISVREYALRNNQEVLVFDGKPHGSYYENHLDKKKNRVVTHYYKDRFAYRADRIRLDRDYASVQSGNPGFAHGFDLGYNPSIQSSVLNSGESINFQGKSQPTCFYFSPQVAGGTGQQEFTSLDSLTATNSSGSNANTFNEKNSIGGSYGLFSASNNLAYSNSYQGSYANGSFSFINAVVGNVELTPTGLSDYATDILARLGADQFEQVCGSSVITSIPMGWAYSVNLSLTSSDTKATSSLSDTLKAGYSSFISMTNALSLTSNSSSSTFTASYAASPMGDYTFIDSYPQFGINAGDTFQDTVQDWVINQHQVLSDCLTGGGKGQPVISGACTSDLVAFNNEVAGVLAAVQADINIHGLPNQIGFLDAFPNGVTVTSGGGIGGHTTSQATFTIPAIELSLSDQAFANSKNVSDPFASVSNNLNNYIQVMWQIEQLANAANLYTTYLTGSNSSLSSESLPVTQVFKSLANSYQADVNSMLNTISGCFADSSSCASLPAMTVATAYDYYNTPNLYKAIEPNADTSLLNDKLVNSILLQYQGTYQEVASLSDPANSWAPTDLYYVGNPNPVVSNSVPMAIVYIGSYTANQVSGLPQGLFGIATQGVTMANPFCSPANTNNCIYEVDVNNQANLQNWQTFTLGGSLPTQPFYYVLPTTPGSNGFSDLIGKNVTSGQALSNYFMMAVKYIDGVLGIDAPIGFSASNLSGSLATQKSVYNESGVPLAQNPFLIDPNNLLPPITIYSNGAITNAGPDLMSVNGVFGPVGTSIELYTLLNRQNIAQTNISTIAYDWILGLPSQGMYNQLNNSGGPTGCYGGNGTYFNFSGCDGTGLYPFNDSSFNINGTTWGARAVMIKNTKNSLSLSPISSFFN